MNVNVNDISGFEATAEEIRHVYAERDRLREENEDLKFTLENKEYAEKQTKQFTEDICAALGVRSDMSTRGSILSEISKLRKEHENLKYTIKKQEEFTEEAASILGVSPSDLSLSDVLVALRKLKRCEELNDMNSGIIADLKNKRDKEAGRRVEAERYISNTLNKICSALGIEYSTDTTLEYILDTIDDLRGKKGKYSHAFAFNSVCDYLGFLADDATLSYIHDEIERLKEYEKKYRMLCDDVSCYYMKLGLGGTECNRDGVLKKIDDMRAYTDALKADTIHHDKRRREWVRKYKSEHERANSCDERYKKYKALYEADAPAREKLYDSLASYRASYEAIKNDAIRNRSLINAVAVIVGTEGKHDDLLMANVRKAANKARHWDILVDSYGEGTVRSLLDNIGIDVSGDKGNGLF